MGKQSGCEDDDIDAYAFKQRLICFPDKIQCLSQKAGTRKQVVGHLLYIPLKPPDV